MKITVMCGAGAMSTFVALRLRSVCSSMHRDIDVEVTTLNAGVAPDTDVLLIGHHVPRDHASVKNAHAVGAVVLELPADIAQDLDGSRTLVLVDAALSDAPATAAHVTEARTEPLIDAHSDKGV